MGRNRASPVISPSDSFEGKKSCLCDLHFRFHWTAQRCCGGASAALLLPRTVGYRPADAPPQHLWAVQWNRKCKSHKQDFFPSNESEGEMTGDARFRPILCQWRERLYRSEEKPAARSG